MNVPENLIYTADHEWLEPSDKVIRMGITDYAQEQLGDIVFIDLPAVGTTFDVGEALGEIESTKSVGEIYAPAAGTVAAINSAAIERPELVNSDPFGEGWLLELRFDAGLPPDLLSSGEYAKLLA